jgi:hypothetical protein
VAQKVNKSANQQISNLVICRFSSGESMKFRNTAILLVILAILAVVAVWETHRGPAGESPQEKAKWVFTLGRDDVSEFEVKDGSQSVFMARGGTGDWFIGAIGGPPADTARINSVLDSVVSLKSTRVITDTSVGLAAFGLDNPPVQARLGLGEGKNEVLFIGNENPQGTSYYAQRQGSPNVYLISTSLVDDLKKLVSEPPYRPTPTPPPEPSGTTAATPSSEPSGTEVPVLKPIVTPTP